MTSFPRWLKLATASIDDATSAQSNNTIPISIYGSTGNDIMHGSALADNMWGYAGADVIVGFGGDDYLDGGSGNDTVEGGEGNDILIGGDGTDMLIGGKGDDVYYVGWEAINDDIIVEYATGPFAPEGIDTVYSVSSWSLGSNLENLYLMDRALTGVGNNLDNIIGGSSYDNTLYGLEGDDRLDGDQGADMLFGGAGGDRLDGGAGIDQLWGGEGNDTYIVDNIQDTANEEDDAGIDTVQSNTYSYSLGAHIEILILAATALNGAGNDTDNTIVGNGFDNLLWGLDGDDFIDGGDGKDVLWGADGKDTLIGGGAEDVLYAGAKNDLLLGGEGNDALWGEDGDDRLKGDDGNDVLRGGTGVDQMEGDAGNDTFWGDEGDDTLDGGSGNDFLYGGSGNDIYYVDTANDKIIESENQGLDTVFSDATVYYLTDHVENLNLRGRAIFGFGNGGDNFITGNANANYLSGQGGNDFIFGDAGSDTLSGDDGNDTLDGGVDRDVMAGGNGNDYYYINDYADEVREYSNGGTDTALSFVTSYRLSSELENLILMDLAIIGAGNAKDNLLRGNGNDNFLSGGAGNDLIDGADGRDVLFGDGGNDTLLGGAGADSLNGGSGNDTYLVDDANDLVHEDYGQGNDIVFSKVDYWLGDNIENLYLIGADITQGIGNNLSNIIWAVTQTEITISAGSGNDTVYAGAGNDNILGGEGADLLFGGLGDDTFDNGGYWDRDTMFGGAGNDRYFVNDKNDLIIEYAGEGIDTVIAFVNWRLGAEIENLELSYGARVGHGNSKDNVISGGSAISSSLYGYEGNDTLSSGAGSDYLSGGSGDDLIYQVDSYHSDNPYVKYRFADYLDGGSGNDTIFGDWGDDTLIGGGGDHDSLSGGRGRDTIILSASSKEIVGFNHTLLNGKVDGYDAIQYFNADQDKIDLHDLLDDLGFSDADRVYGVDFRVSQLFGTGYTLSINTHDKPTLIAFIALSGGTWDAGDFIV